MIHISGDLQLRLHIILRNIPQFLVSRFIFSLAFSDPHNYLLLVYGIILLNRAVSRFKILIFPTSVQAKECLDRQTSNQTNKCTNCHFLEQANFYCSCSKVQVFIPPQKTQPTSQNVLLREEWVEPQFLIFTKQSMYI